MREFLSKFRAYRFLCYWLVSWIVYYHELRLYDEFEHANYSRLKLLNILKKRDHEKIN